MILLTPITEASIYTGSWKNKTFGSSGALTVNLTLTKTNASGTFNLDGPVFGGGDPPAIPFNFALKSNGSGTFTFNGTSLGNVKGSVKPDGTLAFTITHIPGGFLTEARINGKFDLSLEKFAGTYEIDNSSGLYATGSIAAHAPKAPVIKAPGKVNVTGAKGEVTAKVVTNTNIKSLTVSADGNAKVTVSGKNPYLITVRKMTLSTTRLTITATNGDNLKTARIVKFVRSAGLLPSD
ncbi:MAG: hypothetical protein ABIT37_24055 [Luteolibacter sp.]